MKRISLGLLLLALAATLSAAPPPAAPKPITKVILSDVYTINQVYRSMEGPGSNRTVMMDEDVAPELVWITGVKTEMVMEDGKTPQLPELMCHVNVDINPDTHSKLFGFQRGTSSRLVTLSQGMLAMATPKGFGFPVVSNEPIQLFTQVLNHNIKNPKDIKVRHRVTFEYYRDKDLQGAAAMKPLFNLGASGMVLLNDNPIAIPSAVDLGGAHGATCLMAPRAPNAAGTASDYVDPEGRKLTGHWVVPPGRQENHSDVTWFMGLPYDVKLHYAAVHLHPFAESLTLRDVTEDKVLFTAKTKNPQGKVGLDHVDTFTSVEGLKLYKSHKYELVSVYNNPTKDMHDSMASVYLGLSDPEFRKPEPELLEARSFELIEATTSDNVVFHTTQGQFGVSLARQSAPETVRQFLKLARAGAVDKAQITADTDSESGASLVRFTMKLNAKQQALINKRLGAEPRRRHEPGSLSVCPDELKPDTFTFS
ncbi:MAG TPA: hypothetical protein VF698_13955, partial [Thermoanaerobaculia bacterium]